jgi:metal-responsive CopG/Arc/MetJ family transcriptional regulator
MTRLRIIAKRRKALNPHTEFVGLKIGKPLLKQLDKLAQDLQVPRSFVIRKLLTEALGHDKTSDDYRA